MDVSGNVNVYSGQGGNGASAPVGSGASGTGGKGGDAGLSINGALSATQVDVIVQGNGGPDSYGSLNPGAGADVGFFANSLAAGSIYLQKDTGSRLAFNVGTLDVTSGNTTLGLWNTTAGTAGTAMNGDGVYIGTVRLGDGQLQLDSSPGYALINTLQLEGLGTFDDTANPVTLGNLAINGGTLHNGNWSDIIDHAYTTPAITLGAGGATVELNIGQDQTLSRNLTGAGSLTLAGGTLQLTGASYGKHWTLGAGSNAIEYNDALNPVTFGGNLTGTGGFAKTGAGTLTLTGTNDYGGGTTVTTGTLQIGNGGDTGSVTGNILNNASLVFNRSDDLTHAGNITGTGTLAKEGAGTLTLSGTNNSYSGDTTVNTGILSLTGSLLNSNIKVESVATFDLSGSAGKDVSLLSGGTLNWRQGGAIGGNLNAVGAILNFYVPDGTAKDTKLLTVTGTADIDQSTVYIGLEGTSTPLTAGDKLVLIEAGTLNNAPANTVATKATGMTGISLIHDFDLTTNPTQLIATLQGSRVTPGTKALSEGFLSGMTLVNQSTDLAAEQGMNALRQEIRRSEGQRPIAFGVLSKGSSRYKTGSHIDVDSLTLTGLAAEVKQNSGDLTLGGFIVYGEGDYDTTNSFANAASVKGSGETDYAGAGVLARLDFNGSPSGHAYIDGALQAGSVKTKFHSKDLVAQGTGARYSTRSNYYGLHLGSGYVWNLGEQSELEASVKYLYAQREGDKLKLNTGDPIRFKTIESHRLRIGARYSWTADTVKPYIGLAWEHEFDGKAKATAYGSAIDTPKLKGDTGIIELGLTMKPSATKPLTVNFGVQGYVGRREGISGSLKAEYRF
ncbi:hypothetical protein FACS1894158_00660 [Betaproteobacteria bacterium]|nr:hypothetical protein FACS1894158_00660 [Betaproteobacteria bacterium]